MNCKVFLLEYQNGMLIFDASNGDTARWVEGVEVEVPQFSNPYQLIREANRVSNQNIFPRERYKIRYEDGVERKYVLVMRDGAMSAVREG